MTELTCGPIMHLVCAIWCMQQPPLPLLPSTPTSTCDLRLCVRFAASLTWVMSVSAITLTLTLATRPGPWAKLQGA
ncbi:hypothetical protein HaLaN_11122 [Haematococcus lacustris]|uniref:Uncharacterized protein n=1 Tax=Haematococcus lacustris TaxID=44745 RepID=A0A699YXH4_HAELA|nr:hypothetical protein HaLaN_11122 [Haematococcus lacustris]